MAQRADDIRHDIEHTRAAMTEKVTILEERVRETAAGVQVSVEKIVEDVGGVVKDVGGIVENVKATVDTTLAAVRQGAAGTQASVEEMVKDIGGDGEGCQGNGGHDPRQRCGRASPARKPRWERWWSM